MGLNNNKDKKKCPNCKQWIRPVEHYATDTNGVDIGEEECPECGAIISEF